MREIDIDQAAAALDDGGTVLDVRERNEYVGAHVPGVTWIPMGQLTNRLDELDKSDPVYVICASGNRSSAMTDVLVAAGFEAYSVAGGTRAWADSGRPLEQGGNA